MVFSATSKNEKRILPRGVKEMFSMLERSTKMGKETDGARMSNEWGKIDREPLLAKQNRRVYDAGYCRK